MDIQAFYLQAAEAAATVTVRDDVEEPKLPSGAAVLLRFDVQQAVGLGADAADAAGEVMDVDDAAAPREGGGVRVCPECGKAFTSAKALYGHLRAHPERRYKGSSRPATPAAAAGEARPRKAPQRKEAPADLSKIKWPVTAKRSRTPTAASSPVVSAEPKAVLLLEAPLRAADPAPLLPEPQPPRGVEHAVELLGTRRSEEEEAAMTLMELYQQMRGEAPPQPAQEQLPVQPIQVVDAVVEHQAPDADQLEAPPADQHAPAWPHAPVEHIFGIIAAPQAVETEQANATAAAASKGKKPMEQEPVKSDALIVAAAEQSNAAAAASKGKKPMQPEPGASDALIAFRDKILSPGASKRPKKRPLDQTQPLAAAAAAAAEQAMPLPPRRIPSPASDRKFQCPVENCGKKFPTYQALGGHMASHNRVLKSAAAQNMEGIAAAHAVQNIMVHHQLRQGALIGENVIPPVASVPKPHSCSRCVLTFPTGQALGGHMRKHWLEEKMRAAPAISLAGPILEAMPPNAGPPAPAANALAVVPANALAPAVPANALAVVPANALALVAVPATIPAAPANALVAPIAAAAVSNGEPRDFGFDLNETLME